MICLMPRPRVYDLDRVLDAAEALAVASGPAAVTIRGISAAVGVSNGALYHSFGSRAGLLAQAWLRAGRRFLDAQAAVVDSTLFRALHRAGTPASRPWWPPLTHRPFSPSSIRIRAGCS